MDDFRKELNRINRYIKRKEKEGYSWSSKYKLSLTKQSLNKLKATTPELILQSATKKPKVVRSKSGESIYETPSRKKKQNYNYPSKIKTKKSETEESNELKDYLDKEERKLTTKERRRIRNYFKANEARGFRWSEEYKKRILSERYDILKNIHAKELLTEATALSPISGKSVSGTQARHEYNVLRGKKAWETRQRRKAQATPDVSTEAYDKIMEMIDNQPLRTASIILRDFLDKEIVNYGFEKVCKGLASAQEEAIRMVEMAMDDSKGGKLRTAIAKLAEIIKGSMLTEDEAKDIGEAMDADESINDGFVHVDEEDIPEQFRDSISNGFIPVDEKDIPEIFRH